ncbi:MAG: hypothetical protein H0U08_12045 [Actinobacteria bacterium]|nr:hypothetical protein [Actinomycetota bacterium]
MDAWDGWPFARVYLLFLAVGFVSLGAQVLLFHWRAGFSRLTMYGPVLLAPVIALAAVVAAIQRDGILGWIALVVFALGVVSGLIGVYEHLNGIRHRIGGFSLRNAMSGPPPFLPAAYLLLSLTGGVAVIWQAL